MKKQKKTKGKRQERSKRKSDRGGARVENLREEKNQIPFYFLNTKSSI